MNELCHKCGVSWEVLSESLHGDGLDREEAILIVNNCPTCQERFDYLLPIYSTLEVELVKEGIKCPTH